MDIGTRMKTFYEEASKTKLFNEEGAYEVLISQRGRVFAAV